MKTTIGSNMETFLQSNEIKIPKSNKVHPSKIDFKSSFARSLTFSNGGGDNQYEVSKSLDFEINLQPCNENENASCDKSAVKVTSLDDDLVVGSFNESFNKSDEDKERQLWSKKQHQQISNDNFNSSDAEILRLRKECQNLIVENRRLQARNPPKISSLAYGSLQYECNSSSNGVENVVLQTKIETLQWQLRQVENSRQMYRCIMEEVARYLEKCHFNFELLQQRERDKVMERSKSTAYIAKGRITNDLLGGVSENDGRARSSTNLLSLNTLQPQRQQKSATILSDISYSAFKDFTWRRSPKCKTSTGVEIKPEKYTFQTEEIVAAPFESRQNVVVVDAEIDAEKLSKEAFRLSRTVQNFLNTHEPILSQANGTSEANTFQRSLEQQRSDFLFGFDRESHLSLRSTDESSVHSSSNSSNSNKEEEDHTILPSIATNKTTNIPAKGLTKSKRFSTCHQTEDESGFSSMNSFHEIGLPLHSTLISVNTSLSSDESHSETVKFKKPAAELKDVVGLPMAPPTKTTVNHRRYESAPVSITQSSKMKILENDEKTMKVLWV